MSPKKSNPYGQDDPYDAIMRNFFPDAFVKPEEIIKPSGHNLDYKDPLQVPPGTNLDTHWSERPDPLN